MATNFVQPGKVLTVAAPYDRTSGQGALIGAIFGVALRDVLSTIVGDFQVSGVWTLAKTSAQAWTLGQKIYWDDTNKRCDNVATVGPLIGVATAVAANPSSTGIVRLNAGAADEATGPQAVIAALTDNGGGAAVDGTIAAIAAAACAGGVSPSAAQVDTAVAALATTTKDAVKELSTEINAILAALKLAGIIAAA
jgi:predicted RecA/RadA family phage recombinase